MRKTDSRTTLRFPWGLKHWVGSFADCARHFPGPEDWDTVTRSLPPGSHTLRAPSANLEILARLSLNRPQDCVAPSPHLKTGSYSLPWKQSKLDADAEALHQALTPPPSSATAKKCYCALPWDVANAFLKILIFLLSFTFSRKFSFGHATWFCGLLFPWSGIEVGALGSEFPGPPGNSPGRSVFKFILFIDVWLRWVFVAAHGLSLVAASGATLRCSAVASLVAEHGL